MTCIFLFLLLLFLFLLFLKLLIQLFAGLHRIFQILDSLLLMLCLFFTFLEIFFKLTAFSLKAFHFSQKTDHVFLKKVFFLRKRGFFQTKLLQFLCFRCFLSLPFFQFLLFGFNKGFQLLLIPLRSLQFLCNAGMICPDLHCLTAQLFLFSVDLAVAFLNISFLFFQLLQIHSGCILLYILLSQLFLKVRNGIS